MKLNNGRRYIAFTAVAFAAFELVLSAAIHRGYDLPQPHPFLHNTWIVDREVMSERDWHDLSRRQLLALTVWVFATSGSSVTLPRDFNASNNTIYAIGAGASGATGQNAPCPMASCFGAGGNGGGGGAFAQISNFNGTPNSSVNIQVGSGDSWFSSTGTLLAKSASGSTGGLAASSVGSPAYNGGSGGSGVTGGTAGAGGGGGGAGGPHGPGNAGAAGSGTIGGSGGSGDAGNTAAGSNGSQFGPNASNQHAGSGGGGSGGNSTPTGATAGSNGGFYGAGGGGGGGGLPAGCVGGGGGSGTQGLLAFTYVSITTAAFNLAMIGM